MIQGRYLGVRGLVIQGQYFGSSGRFSGAFSDKKMVWGLACRILTSAGLSLRWIDMAI